MIEKCHQYAVWGNPIAHSLSPRLHQAFAEQTAQQMVYHARLGDEQQFEQQLSAFFAEGGKGCNVTAPFKGRAFAFAHHHTPRARLAQSCNTLIRQSNGEILGDNTDGVGLVEDLQRLQWLGQGSRILILGAGGATAGILGDLISQNADIALYNRTASRAAALVEQMQRHFAQAAIRHLSAFPTQGERFDLIINATSFGLHGDCPFPAHLATLAPRFYDLQYQLNGLTPFLRFISQHSKSYTADGLGMLLAQGAESFFLWRGVKPNYHSLLTVFRENP